MSVDEQQSLSSALAILIIIHNVTYICAGKHHTHFRHKMQSKNERERKETFNGILIQGNQSSTCYGVAFCWQRSQQHSGKDTKKKSSLTLLKLIQFLIIQWLFFLVCITIFYLSFENPNSMASSVFQFVNVYGISCTVVIKEWIKHRNTYIHIGQANFLMQKGKQNSMNTRLQSIPFRFLAFVRCID